MIQSNYEANILVQPKLIEEILKQQPYSWMSPLKGQRFYFVGIGSSYHVAEIACWLWRKFVAVEAYAVSSFDGVKTPQPFKSGDVVVLFSHSGSKSYTLESAKVARVQGATTVGVTCIGSPWKEDLDYRIETCERENTGAFRIHFPRR